MESDPGRRVTILGMHYTPEPSGNAPYTTGLAEGLAQRGHDVHVVTGVPHYPSWKIFDGYNHWRSTTRHNGVTVTRLRHHVASAPTTRSRLAMEATYGLRMVASSRHRADVVVAVSPALVSSGMAIAREVMLGRRAAVGLWVQDLYSLGVKEANGASNRTAGWATSFESRVARATDGVAVVHPRFRDYVTSTLGLPVERVSVIRNWTHLRAASMGDRRATRESFGWAETELVALHAGNMGVKQGLENVVESARLAASRGTNVRFVMVGGGNQRAQLERQAAGLGSIEFLPSLADGIYQQVLAAADVLLVNEKPGVHEMSVPSKLTSYYTSGRPVIAACEPGSVTAEEVALSGAGVRVAPGRPEELLAACLEVASDAARAAELGDRGKAFVQQELSQATALDGFEEWMARLMAVRDRRRRGA